MEDICKEGHKITINADNEDIVFHTDEKIIKNILINLLSNAIKYSEANTEITITLKEDPNLLSIKVKDQGIGIPEGEQKHMFERFFRAKNATNIQGTGLGLNIVKKYVDMLEGEITFTSKLNEGTTFSIDLPKIV
nr:ATP-binding protein [Fulvivirga sediminis]